MLVQQAIFTSTQTNRAAGYQLAAVSPGLHEADSRELSTWGPSHDSLWETGAAVVSVNFHPLPSGAYCISQTVPAGDEYSQRRGTQVYTQSLVVDRECLAAFANNPFALLRAAVAQGAMRVHAKLPKRLEAVTLEPDPAPLDAELLSLFPRGSLGLLAAVVEYALDAPALGLVAGVQGPRFIAALINCLPVDCRPEFSFTTGLRFSPRRPFRLICLPDAPAENLRLQRQQHFTLLKLDDEAARSAETCAGWARFVIDSLTADNVARLTTEIARPHGIRTGEQLNALGETLCQPQPLVELPDSNEEDGDVGDRTLVENFAADLPDLAADDGESHTIEVGESPILTELPADDGEPLVAESLSNAEPQSSADPHSPRDDADESGHDGWQFVDEDFPDDSTGGEASDVKLATEAECREFELEEAEAAPSDAAKAWGDEPEPTERLAEDRGAERPVEADRARDGGVRRAAAATCSVDVWQRADAPHATDLSAVGSLIADAYTFSLESSDGLLEIAEEPAQVVAAECPDALEQLQRLEDAIFEVVAGKTAGLQELAQLWRQVLKGVGRAHAEATREQYLRYALSVWRQFTSGDDIGDPERACNAMEVVCLLFDRH